MLSSRSAWGVCNETRVVFIRGYGQYSPFCPAILFHARLWVVFAVTFTQGHRNYPPFCLTAFPIKTCTNTFMILTHGYWLLWIPLIYNYILFREWSFLWPSAKVIDSVLPPASSSLKTRDKSPLFVPSVCIITPQFRHSCSIHCPNKLASSLPNSSRMRLPPMLANYWSGHGEAVAFTKSSSKLE